jgi:predicted lipoprotein
MKKIVSIVLVLSVLFGACKKDDNNNTEDKFDRGLMLKNYAENLIIPAYKDLQTSVNLMLNAFDTFSSNATLQNLENAQNAWVAAYSEWMYANAFNIGPAAEQGLNKSLAEEISTFPVSTTKINTSLTSGQYNFNDFNRDARGFLAIEYLLFEAQNVSKDSVLILFQSQANRKSFLVGCAQNIQSRINNVVSEWEGGYKSSFLSKTGTDVGSSTSQLYNEFVKAFETNKNFKIELPLGKRPGQAQAEPQLVEAYYSGKSLDFLKIHLKSIENIYFGKSKNGTDGIGFKNYLETVTGGPALIESTLAQWEKVLSSLNAIPTTSSLSELIKNNPKPVEDFGVELQKHTRFFKSDMSSMLGIAITFSSGDGD